MLSLAVFISILPASVAQEVRVAVEPKGEVAVERLPPKFAHAPTLRMGGYGVTASMAQRSIRGFSNDPFGELDHIEQKLADAKKKMRHAEVAHRQAKNGEPTERIKQMVKDQIKQVWDKNPPGPEMLSSEEKRVGSLMTKVKCKGEARNKTCDFKNLYYEGGKDPTWHILLLKGHEVVDTTGLSFASKYGGPVPIAVTKFDNRKDAVAFLKRSKPKQHHGLSLIYAAMWHQNMGHALWDGLYPAYTSLVQWGRQDEKFRSVVDHNSECYQANTEDGRCMSEGVFKKFGMGDWISMQDLHESDRWHCFTDAVVGSGNRGARVINRDYSLPNGREMNAVRFFRDRMYKAHGLEPPAARAYSAQHRYGPRSMRGIIVHNSKYSKTEKVMMTHLATAVGSMATQFTEDDGVVGSTNFQYVDLSDLASFKQQLELIQHTDVHMSAVGAAASLAPFLGDGSVHVNLGNNEWPGNQQVYEYDAFGNGQPKPYSEGHGVSYMEEYWAEGVPYIRALYYNSTTQHTGLKRRELQTLAQKAYRLIRSNFSIPVEPGANLSPVGKTFKEYCQSDQEACDYMLAVMNGEAEFNNKDEAEKMKDCETYAWAEMAVFEVGAYSDHGHNGQYCNLHHIEKLRAIRKKNIENPQLTVTA